MVIRLSPTIQKRVTRAAKAKGIEPSQLVEDALKEFLRTKREPREQVSEARRQLDELLRHKKKTVDFEAEVHQAKRSAGKLYEDNADWIERVAAEGTEHGKGAGL